MSTSKVDLTKIGLNSSEVKKREADGKINTDASIKTRSIGRIFYENIFTLFNAVNVILALIVLCTGSYKNMLFMGVIICNTAIGIIQEIRSKKTTDRLTIVAAAKARVVRDGKLVEIDVNSIVLDDVIELKRGDQVPADCVVLHGTCDANESLLTGESDLIHKETDSELMSGSFVNSGHIYARVIHVGADNYATKITAEAKAHKKVNSQIMETMNGLIRFVSFIIFPLGIILFCKAHFFVGTDVIPSILTTVSALIGMIPEGLILLTSTVLAVSVIRLAQHKVLVQQLYCIETLARVDTICLDKTGTITSGNMELKSLEVAKGSSTNSSKFAEVLYNLANSDDDKNETAIAIDNYFKAQKDTSSNQEFDLVRPIPFSSDKKYSGAEFKEGAYVQGATQFILPEDGFEEVKAQAQELAADSRVLLVAKVDGFDANGNIVGNIEPLGFACIVDEIRATAASTIKFFTDEGVRVKVISGDDPRTVSGIAKQVGVVGADNYVDATTLKSDEDIEEAMAKYSVFGRVKPEQKKAFVVALQKAGHTVAMTGDGVNDTLALKQADCSVAMASGSSAARNVSNLVLIENDFAAMTNVVAEGRRSINNLQRSASLFLVKTLLSMSLSVLFLLLPFSYPFQPIQLTLISSFTIGLPSFILALEPNKDRIKGHFLANVIVKSIPSAFAAVLGIVIINLLGYNVLGLDYGQVSTLCVLTVSVVGVSLICKLSWPFTPIRIALIIVIILGTILGCAFFGPVFSIVPFTETMTTLFVGISIGAIIVFAITYYIVDKFYNKYQSKFV